MAEVVAGLVRERLTLAPGFGVTLTGRTPDPAEVGTSFGTSNLADHVGDDPERVMARRAALALDVGVRTDHLVYARAEHGTTIVRVTRPQDAGRAGDGVVTDAPGFALMAMAADCVPFALVDVDTGTMAAVHAGWRGCAAGIGGRAVAAMVECGAAPRNLRIYVGPAVCGRCYEVGDDVLAALAIHAVSDRWRTTTRHGASGVDLRDYLTDALVDAGVPASAIQRSSACTVEDQGYFSHRRDGARPTGRHALVVHRVPT